MMTKKEFEAWLDEAAAMNRMTYENSGFSESSLDYITQDFKCGARAAWAKAQDEMKASNEESAKKGAQAMFDIMKPKADKLVEALDGICSPLNQDEDFAYEIAYKILKEYRGEND